MRKKIRLNTTAKNIYIPTEEINKTDSEEEKIRKLNDNFYNIDISNEKQKVSEKSDGGE